MIARSAAHELDGCSGCPVAPAALAIGLPKTAGLAPPCKQVKTELGIQTWRDHQGMAPAEAEAVLNRLFAGECTAAEYARCAGGRTWLL